MTAQNQGGLQFESPPPTRAEQHGYDWDAIAEQLRKNPMEWATVFRSDRTSLATAIRNGGIKALLPSKGFEVTTRNNKRTDPRTCTLFLRYNPAYDRGGDDAA